MNQSPILTKYLWWTGITCIANLLYQSVKIQIVVACRHVG